MCAIFFLVSCSLSHFSLLLPYPLQYFQILVWFLLTYQRLSHFSLLLPYPLQYFQILVWFLLTYQHRRWFIYYIIFSKVWTILGRVWKTFMDTINNNLVKNWPQPVTCKWNMYFCFCMPGAKCISHLHAGLFNRDEQRIRGPHACPASHSWHQGAHTFQSTLGKMDGHFITTHCLFILFCR
jgi:hypothetical protein